MPSIAIDAFLESGLEVLHDLLQYSRILLIWHLMVRNARWLGDTMENKFVRSHAEAASFVGIDHDWRSF